MAEGADLVFDLLREAGNAGQLGPVGTKSANKNVERLNLFFLFLGKLLDLVADWVIVVQVFSKSAPVSGCTNTCEFASNFVCQDGHDVTSISDIGFGNGACINQRVPHTTVGNLSNDLQSLADTVKAQSKASSDAVSGLSTALIDNPLTGSTSAAPPPKLQPTKMGPGHRDWVNRTRAQLYAWNPKIQELLENPSTSFDTTTGPGKPWRWELAKKLPVTESGSRFEAQSSARPENPQSA